MNKAIGLLVFVALAAVFSAGAIALHAVPGQRSSPSLASHAVPGQPSSPALPPHAMLGQPPSPGLAPPPAMMAPPQMMALPEPVFGFPGKECPKGSELYKGPEVLSAGGDGVVYCTFVRRYRELPRAMFNGKCPSGAEPFAGEGFKTDGKSIWCDMSVRLKPLPPPPKQ